MHLFRKKYPAASDRVKVGSYPAEAYAGGGYFYDDVLEYRVWVKEKGETAYYAFPSYKDALHFSGQMKNAEEPVALIRQDSYIAESDDGHMEHVHQQRIAEWQVEWLKGNRGTAKKIPPFIVQRSK